LENEAQDNKAGGLPSPGPRTESTNHKLGENNLRPARYLHAVSFACPGASQINWALNRLESQSGERFAAWGNSCDICHRKKSSTCMCWDGCTPWCQIYTTTTVP